MPTRATLGDRKKALHEWVARHEESTHDGTQYRPPIKGEDDGEGQQRQNRVHEEGFCRLDPTGC
jgi:hypothetical protein